MTTISSVTTQPSTGTAGLGDDIKLDVLFTNGVVVHGTPLLTLNDGETASFVSQADGYISIFDYVVKSADKALPLAVTGISLPNGASIIDYSGNPVTASNLNLVTNLRVDANKPSLSAVTTDPNSGVAKSGQAVNFTITLSQPVTVSGSPTLTLNDGPYPALYNSILSSPFKLVFTQVVGGFENVPSGSKLSITAVNLNGASVVDGYNQPVDFSSIVGPVASGSLVIDGTVPSLGYPISTPSSGTLTGGQTLTITAYNSAIVKVTGNLTLSLSDGGVATYDPTQSKGFGMVFTETIQPGENTSSLAVTGINLNGGTVTDYAGVDVDLSSYIGPVKGSVMINAPGGAPLNNTPVTNTPANSTPVTNTPVTNTPVTNTPIAPATVLAVFRFFDTHNGTHFFTSDNGERDTILATRPDLKQETNGYGAVPAGSDAALSVYRFFDTIHGTQFITSSASERDTVIGSRPDLKYEASGTFYEHATQQTGDVAIYRFFDTKLGTHFYTGSSSEASGLQQAGGSSYRPDLKSEGIAFYAPSGSFT